MTTATEKLRRPPVLCDEAELATIARAIVMQHACDGNLDAPTQISDGAALAGICAGFIEATTAAMRASKGASKAASV